LSGRQILGLFVLEKHSSSDRKDLRGDEGIKEGLKNNF